MSGGDGAGFRWEAAPAKVNLALHVTGRRDDGYHLLDSVVVHGGAADRVGARLDGPASADGPRITLTVEGPFAAGLSGGDNLVLGAARLLAAEAAQTGRAVADVTLRLDKRLPITSGIGGGSADAAATLRLLDRLWDLGFGRARLAELSLRLGADLPMCVDGRPARIGGIGEAITPLARLPAMRLMLINPGVPVATPAVFRGLARRDNPPLPTMPERFDDLERLIDWLATTRNDLQAAAIGLAPAIGTVLAHLAAMPGCRLARMSGSGATCFGIFAADADTARPDDLPAAWWVAGPTAVGDAG